jgi:predicted acylesterase/phospholipase RssA
MLPKPKSLKLTKSPKRQEAIYLPSVLRVSLQSVLISANNLITLHLKQAAPDLLIAPKIESYDMFDFHKGSEMIQCGYDAAQEADLDQLLQSPTQ